MTSTKTTFLYVSPRGQDSSPGTEDQPLRTIQAAAERAKPGETVRILPGVYREWVQPPAGGTSDQARITFEGWGEGDVILTGAEPLTAWSHQEGDLWLAEVDNEIFGGDNPYDQLLSGHWFIEKERNIHRGQLYRNGHWLREAAAKEELFPETGFEALWFAETDDQITRILAQFPDGDPNQECIEFNVRRSVFYPATQGISWLTLRGLTFRCAATPWSPPTTEQIGVVGTNWGQGWIIEDCEVCYTSCAGITLGKYYHEEDRGEEPVVEGTDGGDTYHHTIHRALEDGWQIGKTGDHLVRRCKVHHCEQAGICGSLGPVRCRIEQNEIYEIHMRRQFTGYEQAGIKFHGAVDTVIESNHIHHCYRGMWLDWMTQGTRICRNVFHHNGKSHDLFVEVNHGPFVVDHNFFLSPLSLLDISNGGAYVHNLFAGIICANPDLGRQTPWLEAHGTKVSGLKSIAKGDNRFFNNLFQYPANLETYQDAELPMKTGGNVYLLSTSQPPMKDGSLSLNGEVWFVQEIDREDGLFLHCSLNETNLKPEYPVPHPETELGCTVTSSLPFENPDGTPVDFDHDSFNHAWADRKPGPCPRIWHTERFIRIC